MRKLSNYLYKWFDYTLCKFIAYNLPETIATWCLIKFMMCLDLDTVDRVYKKLFCDGYYPGYKYIQCKWRQNEKDS